jgi:hypothetical protein
MFDVATALLTYYVGQRYSTGDGLLGQPGHEQLPDVLGRVAAATADAYLVFS